MEERTTPPFPSWIYDEIYKRWNPPYNHDDDGFIYFWDEENTQWVKTDIEI